MIIRASVKETLWLYIQTMKRCVRYIIHTYVLYDTFQCYTVHEAWQVDLCHNLDCLLTVINLTRRTEFSSKWPVSLSSPGFCLDPCTHNCYDCRLSFVVIFVEVVVFALCAWTKAWTQITWFSLYCNSN